MREEEVKNHSEKSDKAQSSDIFWFFLLLSIGAFLRFYRLGWHSIWADEGGSILVAGMNIHSMFSFIIHQDAHPPLFFLILHGVLALGRSEFLLRVPSALFGILSLALTYGIARRLFNTVTARIALFLMAFSAAQIYITQEIRMYPYYISLSLLSTYLFLRTVEKPSWPAAALYCLSMIMTLYTHYMAVIVLLCHGAALLVIFREKEIFRKSLAAQVVAFITFLPWISAILIQQKAATTPPFPFHLSSCIHAFFAFFSGFTFVINQRSPEYYLVLLFSLVIPVVMALSIPGGWKGMEKKNRVGILFVLISLLLPMAVLALASLFKIKHLFAIKYITFTIPFYYILLAFLSQTAEKRIFVYILPVVFLFINVVALHNWYFIPEFQKQRWKEAITWVRSERQSGDAFLIQDFLQVNCLEYYLGGKEEIFMIRPAEMPAAIETLSQSHLRIWYIASCGWRIKDPELKLIMWLSENMTEKEVRTYRNIDPYADIVVILFEKKGMKETPTERRER
ncbi:MAG: glycosyltransferase family 39 protein [Vulcanimicrobiota bacterium]